MHKLVSAFRHDIGTRFAFKNSKDNKAGTIEDQKSKSILSLDRRKYKESIIQDVVQQLTFSPKIP